MDSVAFVLPIIPGKEEADLEMFEGFKSGAGKDAFEAWHRSHGVRRHAVWHQKTPDGTVAIVLLEADDIGQALGGVATSQEPFDQHFRDSVKDIHGVDLANDPPAEVTQLSTGAHSSPLSGLLYAIADGWLRRPPRTQTRRPSRSGLSDAGAG